MSNANNGGKSGSNIRDFFDNPRVQETGAKVGKLFDMFIEAVEDPKGFFAPERDAEDSPQRVIVEGRSERPPVRVEVTVEGGGDGRAAKGALGRYCEECGARVGDAAKFCAGCGRRVSA